MYRYYYSDELTTDPEGNLVQLCDRCAQRHRGVAQWAGDGADGCELCDAGEGADAPAAHRPIAHMVVTDGMWTAEQWSMASRGVRKLWLSQLSPVERRAQACVLAVAGPCDVIAVLQGWTREGLLSADDALSASLVEVA